MQPVWNRHQETTIRRQAMEKEAREEEAAGKNVRGEKNSRDRCPVAYGHGTQ
ncbi:hypothetical protein [Enterobacter mori]